MGAYENYTGPIYNPAGEQALAQGLANMGQIVGGAIEKRAAIERAEAERKRKEEAAAAKERQALNRRIQAEAFTQTAAANATLNKEIDEAGIDKELIISNISPLMDELGQLGARLKYDTNLSGREYAEAKRKYSKLYTALNNDLPETLDLLADYAESTKNAAEVGAGLEGGFDEYDDSNAYYSKMVINGKIQGKYTVGFDEDYNPMVRFTGIEGMEPFEISADSFTRPNYNVVPKGTDMARTELDDAHFSDMIKGYTTKDGAMSIMNDAKASGVDSGYREFIGRDGSLYAQLDSSVITNKARPILQKAAITLTSDDLSAAVYYNNRLRTEEEKDNGANYITLVDGQLTPEDKAKIQEAYIKEQGQKVYETSGANKAILVKSASQLRQEQDTRKATETAVNSALQKREAINNEIANRSNELIQNIIGQDPSTVAQRLENRATKAGLISNTQWNPETKTLSFDLMKTGDDPRVRGGKKLVKEGSKTYVLDGKNKGLTKLLNDVVFDTGAADKKLAPYIDMYANSIIANVQEQEAIDEDTQNFMAGYEQALARGGKVLNPEVLKQQLADYVRRQALIRNTQ